MQWKPDAIHLVVTLDWSGWSLDGRVHVFLSSAHMQDLAQL